MIVEQTAARCGETGTVKMRVLVVEDHRDSAESMASIVRLFGYEAVVAFDGPSALAKCESDPPDVVLLDIGLPGMNGYEVARQLHSRAVCKRPFVIAITGYGQEEDRRLAAEAGIDLHILKPADLDYLERLLHRMAALVH